jgi:hypothetical protein
LIVFLILLGAIVSQSFAQDQFPELFDKLAFLLEQQSDPELLPIALNEVFPQGMVPVAPAAGADGLIPNEQFAAAEVILHEFNTRADKLIGLTENMALNVDSPPENRNAALRVENFLQYYKTLVQMTADGGIALEDPAVGAQQVVEPNVVVIRQFVNPMFITYWRPWPDGPRDIEEKVFTAEIPIWGAAVVVKEVRGVKLELVRGPLPINPCWWWRFGHPYNWQWHWWWYYYRLVPSEFIKTISYINTWNYEKRQPEVIQNVGKEIVLDHELMKFWWFLSDPKAAAPELEGENMLNMGSSQGKVNRQAVVWGNLKHSR